MVVRLSIVVCALLLAGCALPPAVTVATLAADGFSYMVSGKSLSDHALSAVAKRDCAVLRALRGNAICQSPKRRTAVAARPAAAVAAGARLSEVAPAAGGRRRAAPADSAVVVAARPPRPAAQATPSVSAELFPTPASGRIVDAPGRGALVGGPGDDRFLFRLANARGAVMVDTVGRNVAEIDCGERDGVEVFAMPTDDGGLEVYAYDTGAPERERLRLVFTVKDYTRNPAAFAGVVVNGSFHATEDIRV